MNVKGSCVPRHAAQIGMLLLFALSHGSVLAHGEGVVTQCFWGGFAVSQAFALLVIALAPIRGRHRVLILLPVILGAGILAWIAVSFRESGLVWPLLLLAPVLSVAGVLLARTSIKRSAAGGGSAPS